MRVINTNRHNKYFQFFLDSHRATDPKSGRINKLFDSASFKYNQYHYCYDRILETLKEHSDESEVIQTADLELKIMTYLEGLIITSRTACDIALTGVLKLKDIDVNLDSMAGFLNQMIKAEKRNIYTSLESFTYWSKLANEHKKDIFSWTRILFRVESDRSLRDQISHKQNIELTITWDIEENQYLYIRTGEKIKEKNRKIPIQKELIPFINDLIKGVDDILNVISQELNSYLLKR